MWCRKFFVTKAENENVTSLQTTDNMEYISFENLKTFYPQQAKSVVF